MVNIYICMYAQLRIRAWERGVEHIRLYTHHKLNKSSLLRCRRRLAARRPACPRWTWVCVVTRCRWHRLAT